MIAMKKIEVSYALPDKQRIIALEVEDGCTVFDAAVQSGIAHHFPELDLEQADMGVFGKVIPRPRETTLQEGDRVEIYRPLIADPKEARKARAAKKKAAE